MTENLEELPVSSIEKSSSYTTNMTEKEMFKRLIEKLDKQDRINKELIENKQKLMEKLQSIEDNQNGRKRKREDSISGNPAKRADSDVSAEDTSSSTESKSAITTFGKTGKCFTLKHTFKNLSKLENGVRVHSEIQEHFGTLWRMYIYRNEEHLSFFTSCQNNSSSLSIETECEWKMLSKNRNPDIRKTSNIYKNNEVGNSRNLDDWGWLKYKNWDVLKQELSIEDSLTFEVSINIKKTTGIYKDDLRCFNDPECSDVVLIVQDKKFHILKLYLAAHSSYFKAMFLGMFGDAKKSEIPLSGVDPDDFQNYLESTLSRES